MSDDSEHSILSASGAPGWSVCAARPAAESLCPSGSSEFADEGTAAHELAKIVLEPRVKGKLVSAVEHIGLEIKVGERTFTVDKDMATHVDSYVDGFMIWSNGRAADRMVEVKVNYAHYLGVPQATAWGTSDGVAVLPHAEALEHRGRLFPAGVELQVHDLKYGRGVRVSAQDNAQLRLYALGTLFEYEMAYNIDRVRMVIHQPRLDHIDEEIISADELRAWAETLKPKAQAALQAYQMADGRRSIGDHVEGILADLHASGRMEPGEKQCRFCDARAVCPALRQEVAETVRANASTPADFADLTVKSADMLAEYNANALGACMDKIPLIEAWIGAVRAEVARRLHDGQEVGSPAGGYMLVEGKLGNRTWIDEKAVIAKLRALKVPEDDIFDRKLISPAVADKVFKATPQRLTALAGMTTRKPGAPSVALKAEGRQPLAQQTLDAFSVIPTGKHPFRD